MESDAPLKADESLTAGKAAGESAAPAAGSMWRRLGPARWLGILWATAPALSGITLITFLGVVSEWLAQHPADGLAIYVAIFTLSAGAGLLPTYAQSFLGGWVFGLWRGFGAAIVAFTAASLIGYLIARTVARDRVEHLVESNVKARAVREALIGRGTWATLGIVALIRMPPNSPFALTNLAMASVGVRVFPYLAGTALGMAPRTGLAAYLAASVQSTGARDIQEAFRERGVGVLLLGLAAMIIVIAVIGAIANHALSRVTARPAPPAA